MQPVSVVILTKNEEQHIEAAIASAKLIADEIVVVDSGSTDNTVAIAKKNGAKVITVEWTNFGSVRNKGAAAAKNNWIFALDADERVSPELAESLNSIELENGKIYGTKRLNFLYGKPVRHGEWGRDTSYRLYDKNKTVWKEVAVHESLIIAGFEKVILKGKLLHFTMNDAKEYEAKTIRYAKLNAEKYKDDDGNNVFKRIASPAFSFIQNYIFRLGFLDGKAGLTVAKMTARYTYLKYKFLHEQKQQHKN